VIYGGYTIQFGSVFAFSSPLCTASSAFFWRKLTLKPVDAHGLIAQDSNSYTCYVTENE